MGRVGTYYNHVGDATKRRKEVLQTGKEVTKRRKEVTNRNKKGQHDRPSKHETNERTTMTA